MADIVWADTALAELDAIADYVALRDERAARNLVRRVMVHVGQLAEHPLSGAKLTEFEDWRYRQIFEPPCRIIYRADGGTVRIVHVVRAERRLDPEGLRSHDDRSRR